MSEPRLLLGYVVRAHGLKGALRLHPASGRADVTGASLRKIKTIYLGEQAYTLLRIRPDKDDLLLELEGVADRDGADALRGREVFVDRDVLPPPGKDEVYLADLVGCEVVSPEGQAIGRITGTFNSGAHELLVLDVAGREVLLPFVPPMLFSVELEARRVVYDAPPGMIDEREAEVVPQGD